MRPSPRSYLVTGGAGFIGSTLVRRLLEREPGARVVVADSLTYAGCRENLADLLDDPTGRVELVVADVRNRDAMRAVVARTSPRIVFHLAAETHVDRSIEDARPFVDTNVLGTLSVLEAVREVTTQGHPRIVHVSTDEVLGPAEPGVFLDEGAPTRPSSPYAASKAGAEALVLAFAVTHGLDAVIARPTNHFGPRQLAEKLVPLVICRALLGLSLPVYGDGLHRRDWLFVDDGCDALIALGERGRPGALYHLASGAERTTLEMVGAVCDALDELAPAAAPRRGLVAHVDDRPGHDRRYGVDASRVRAELGWSARTSFADAMRRTVASYLEPRELERAKAHLERRGRLR